MTIGIYSITNKINGKRYIGKSINIEKRFWKHKNSLVKPERDRKQTNRHLYHSVQKYGITNFDFEILKTFDEVDDKSIGESELEHMDKYNTCNRDFGYNLRRDTSTGMVTSEETRQIMSKNMRGEGNGNYGNRWNDEQRNNMSKRMIDDHAAGEIYGESWKNKISIRSTELWKDEDKKNKMVEKVSTKNIRYNFQQFTRSGEYITTFSSIKAIVEAIPNVKWQNIYSVCNGYKKTYLGFIWKKIDKVLDDNTPVIQNGKHFRIAKTETLYTPTYEYTVTHPDGKIEVCDIKVLQELGIAKSMYTRFHYFKLKGESTTEVKTKGYIVKRIQLKERGNSPIFQFQGDLEWLN